MEPESWNRVKKSPRLVPILSQINTVQTPPVSLRYILFKTLFVYSPRGIYDNKES
jgi:hypothetical protein